MNLKRLYAVVVPWFLLWGRRVFILSSSWPHSRISQLCTRFLELEKERGSLATIKYIKGCRTAFLAYLSGKPVKVAGVRLTSDGLPKVLGPLIPYLRSAQPPVDLLRFVRTVLWRPRCLALGRVPDITPIVRGPKVRYPNTFGKYRFDFWRELGYRPSRTNYPGRLKFKGFHFTTKSGPNGHRLGTRLWDFLSLSSELRSHLENLGGSNFKDKLSVLDRCKLHLSWLFKPEWLSSIGQVRKLSYFPDREDKVRVIGIGDYFSQSVLRPWHSYFYRVLRNIPQDCTFDQGSFKDKIQLSGVENHCIDLTAATDRFPILRIEAVLRRLLPADKVASWKYIIVGSPFSYKGRDGKSQLVNYQVGNPIGLYSSWRTFAVAHHYVMYYCCRELKINWKTAKYCILGDDLVISDPLLGAKYMEVITSLGVDFSPQKTIISSYVIEFAKRLFYNGSEITPFPFSPLLEAKKHYYVLVALLIDYKERGWLTTCGIPSRVGEWFSIRYHRRANNVRRVIRSSFSTERMILCMRKALPAGEALTSLAQDIGYFDFNFTDEVRINILRNIRVEVFRETNPANQKTTKGVGLGPAAIRLVERLTGETNSSDESVGIERIYALPQLARYGQVELMYIRLNNVALETDRKGLDWDPLMKVMALPLDDLIFTQRTDRLIYKGSSLMGKHLKDRFDVLRAYPQLLQM